MTTNIAARRFPARVKVFALSTLIIACVAGAWNLAAAARPRPVMPQRGAVAPGQTDLQTEIAALDAAASGLRVGGGRTAGPAPDAALFVNAARWALRYQPEMSASDTALAARALARARERTAAIASGRALWEQKRGRLVRGYVSAVDGSVQPYGLVIPAGYDPAKPIRLDVVLHGSVRPDGMAMLRFVHSFDDGDTGGTAGDASYIELHPMGRVENCYRWAGETDVFEAIQDTCRRYRIDPDRIVLRGMSMGASGTWHLGLKHPDFFVALGPYCGYVDTHRFSETPGMNFVKVGPLPDIQEQMLHMLDSVDFAANAGVVPVVAAIGDRDPFFQAHVIMGDAFKREGLTMVNLISPGTGHVQDPATWAEQMRRIGAFADRGLDHAPRHIRFVTWTLKYARCHWIELLGLDTHYRRAEIDASAAENGDVIVNAPTNVRRFAIYPPMLATSGARLFVAGQEVARIRPSPTPARRNDPMDLPVSSSNAATAPPPVSPAGGMKHGIVVERRGAKWAVVGSTETVRPTGKRPGLQGPIDDAFTSPFMCVRGTGTPWNPAIQEWADASLRRFAYEWNRYFLGDLPIKNDTDVTANDCRSYNLILFGDPGSNVWIRKALPALPLRWTRDTVTIAGARFPAAVHAPACIAPSPFTRKGGPARYVTLNSGHTFHEEELARLNYLLFPRLGDWALFKVGARQPQGDSIPTAQELITSGFWNEEWNWAPLLPAP